MALLKFGYPFRGFTSAVPRIDAPPDMLTADSRDWLFRRGRIVKRGGSAIKGDTAVGGVEVTGILEWKWGALPKKLKSLASPSITDGYGTHAVQYGLESAKRGQLYFRSTNGNTNETIGKEFGATHYSTAASTVVDMKVPPIAFRGDTDGGCGLHRLNNKLLRSFTTPGSRDWLQVGNWVYFPNADGIPGRWNGRWNPSGSGTQKLRYFPTGHIPPLYMPTLAYSGAAGSATPASNRPWQGKESFYYSVMYQWEDGSFSIPTIPRPISTTLTAGYGLISKLDGTNPTFYYESVTWSGVPIGPDGVIARILLRSPKVDGNTQGNYPVIDDLRICGILNNNTQTTYVDTNGNDNGLTTDALRVRFDHKWPSPARYIGKCDGHILSAYLKVNPAAIILAPTGSAASADLNFSDDSSSAYGSLVWLVRVISGTLQLHEVSTPGVPTTTSITISATVTLQDVVDQINATLYTGNASEWRAQIAPGADPFAPSSNLQLTYISVANTSGTINATSITTSGSFSTIGVGMVVRGDAGIPANTYVGSVATGAQSIGLVDANGAAVQLTATFGPKAITFNVDTGDTAHVNDGTYGYMRAVTQSYPVVLPFNAAYLDTFAARKQAMQFTGASAGAAAYAANNHYTGNERSLTSDAGVCMGVGGVGPTGIVFYAKAIGKFWNPRGGGTHDDADYHLIHNSNSRGCISPYSICEANGCVVFLSTQGLYATTGEPGQEVCISGAVYNPDDALGEWNYAMGICRASAETDGESFPFHCAIKDGILFVTYATSLSEARQMRYDFSLGTSGHGVADLMDQQGQPWPWSTPITLAGLPVGAVEKSDGRHFYMAVEGNQGAAGDGRVDEFETGTDDNGTTIAPLGYCGIIRPDDFQKLMPIRSLTRYAMNGVGLAITVDDQDRAQGVQKAMATTGASTTVKAQQDRFEGPTQRRQLTNLELQIYGSSGVLTVPTVYGVTLDVEYAPLTVNTPV